MEKQRNSQKITKEQVLKMAQLNSLDLPDSEIKKLAQYFTDTLDHINILDELSIENTPETYQVTGLKNVFMVGKENTATLTQKEALSNANAPQSGLFSTKGVFGSKA